MSTSDKREIKVSDPETGTFIELTKVDGDFHITDFHWGTYGPDPKPPLELSPADRRALMSFLNQGEFRELTYGEAR